MSCRDFAVVEITRTYAGGYAGRLLAEAGLPVLKIETEALPDLQRLAPFTDDGASVAYLSAHGKKAMLRLDPAADAAAIRRLVAGSAVLLTDSDAWDHLAGPRVTCRIRPYAGAVAGWCDLASADTLVQAASGAVSMTGHLSGPPVAIGFPVGDVAPGIYAAIGVLDALLKPGPETVTVRAIDATVSLLSYLGCCYMVDGEEIGFIGSGHPYIVPYGAYRAKDGFVIVAALTQVFWRKLCHAMDREDLIAEPRFKSFVNRRENRDELNALIGGIFAERTVAAWIDALTLGDVPHSPVFSVDRALDHPAAAARGMIAEVRGRRLIASPIVDISAGAAALSRPACVTDVNDLLARLGGLPTMMPEPEVRQ